MGDERMRAMERAAATGDEVEAERLEANRRRFETPLETTERHVRAERERGVFARFTPAVRSRIRAVYLAVLGLEKLPRGAAAEVHALTDRLCAEQLRANAITESEARWERAEALLPKAKRMALDEALDEAQGTAKERLLYVSEVEALIERARNAPECSEAIEADTNEKVARSYSYPVSYTVARAYRLGDQVVVEILRTKTYGRRPAAPSVVVLA